jgi:integrase
MRGAESRPVFGTGHGAGLRQLRFHDLRHTFGTRIAMADIRRVQKWAAPWMIVGDSRRRLCG